MSFVIFDTEYTSWKGCQENGWHGNQKKEIVQIAAIKVSDKLEVLDSFDVLCKPSINPVLSDYFVNLTHITNEQVTKHGKSFEEAYGNFENFIASDICYSHGWGAEYFSKSDGTIIDENLKLYDLRARKNIKYRNIAPVFKHLYTENKINIKSQSSGQIAEILGLSKNMKKLKLNQHNAFYDVYSIVEGLKYFYPKSIELLNIFESKNRSDKC